MPGEFLPPNPHPLTVKERVQAIIKMARGKRAARTKVPTGRVEKKIVSAERKRKADRDIQQIQVLNAIYEKIDNYQKEGVASLEQLQKIANDGQLVFLIKFLHDLNPQDLGDLFKNDQQGQIADDQIKNLLIQAIDALTKKLTTEPNSRFIKQFEMAIFETILSPEGKFQTTDVLNIMKQKIQDTTEPIADNLDLNQLLKL